MQNIKNAYRMCRNKGCFQRMRPHIGNKNISLKIIKP